MIESLDLGARMLRLFLFIFRNLSGMSSEESLTSRLRPGVTTHKLSRQVGRADFTEELMRLINPDLSENDLLGYHVSTCITHHYHNSHLTTQHAHI